MRGRLFLAWVACLGSVCLPGPTCPAATTAEAKAVKPEVDAPEGRRAFDDLAAYYADPNKPPDVGRALADLKAADPAARRAAGQYLLALFRQSFADEYNGRAQWRQLPYFGGGSENPAREFRKRAADEFGKAADGEAAVDAALWLVNGDRLPDANAAGAAALRRITGPGMAGVYRSLLAPVHPNTAVAVAVVEAAGERGIKELAPEVAALCTHYRTAVREAALKAAPMLGVAKPPVYKPEAAFTPWLEGELKDVAGMVLTPVPNDAKWKRFTVAPKPDPRRQGAAEEPPAEFSGWLLAEDKDSYKVLDLFADETTLEKARTKAADRSFAEDAATYLKVRDASKARDPGDPGRRDAMESLSRRGGLTGQFEPGFVSLPETLLAAWAFGRGDRAASAAVLFPRLDEARDQRWIKEVARDLLGRHYHEQMLEAFSHRRDYPAALALALHLSKPLFEGYQYQERAVELSQQLGRRADDFKTHKLPTPDEWKKLQATTARPQQIDYLARRLRLLNCIQMSQPGGVDYDDPQYDRPTWGFGAGDADAKDGKDGKDKPVEVINPYVELQKMRLEVRDLPALVPFLADEDYLPTFSYWRDFHPNRTLHRVNWLAANLVNDAAKRDLADLRTYNDLDADGKRKHLEKVMQWVAANAGKSRTDLLMETLTTARDFREFHAAGGELVRIGHKPALPVLVKRAADFPKDRGDVVELCYALAPADALAEARAWVKDADESTRFWAALILLKAGDRKHPGGPEGLAELRPILEKDDGDSWFPRAMDDLLATKDERALDLACTVLGKPALGRGSMRFTAGPMVHRLILAGRKEAADYVVKQLADATAAGTSFGTYQGKEVQRQQVRGDEVAAMVADWRTDGYHFDSVAPDEDRAKERQKLAGWVSEQFELIRAGKEHGIKLQQEPLRASHWRLDAP